MKSSAFLLIKEVKHKKMVFQVFALNLLLAKVLEERGIIFYMTKMEKFGLSNVQPT